MTIGADGQGIIFGYGKECSSVGFDWLQVGNLFCGGAVEWFEKSEPISEAQSVKDDDELPIVFSAALDACEMLSGKELSRYIRIH